LFFLSLFLFAFPRFIKKERREEKRDEKREEEVD